METHLDEGLYLIIGWCYIRTANIRYYISVVGTSAQQSAFDNSGYVTASCSDIVRVGKEGLDLKFQVYLTSNKTVKDENVDVLFQIKYYKLGGLLV